MKDKDLIWLVVLAVAFFWFRGGNSPFVPIEPPPFPSQGLRVLILEETGDRGKLPRPQLAILSSTKLTKWLNEHCVDNGWRKLDDDMTAEELNLAAPVWQEAFTLTKAQSDGKTPWIAITDGKSGESRPLPQTEAELMTILEKYGGA